MANFYTRKGDDGSTGILGNERFMKHDIRMEALGCLDEANAALGMARSSVNIVEIKEAVLSIQKKLYEVMGEIAASEENHERFKAADDNLVHWVESLVEQYSEKVNIPNKFIVPGDTKGSAALALARTIIRRSERRISALLEANVIRNYAVLRFLNRLSSLLFVLELYENKVSGQGQQTLVN